MWTPRTPDETVKWTEGATNDARTHGLLVAGGSWIAISLVFSAGWFASAFGAGVSQGMSGSFWTRLPIIALVLLPFAWLLFRRERSRELEKAVQMTICPKCDTAGEGNAETACDCGGTFVLQSTVKWVDDELD